MLTRREFVGAVGLLVPSLRADLKVRTYARSDSPAGVGADLQVRAQRPRPTKEQLSWQRDELALFLHFGVNTFTDREWGDGKEDPAIFNPSSLDAGQWAAPPRA
jgi:hypothetical protein